MPPPGTGRSIRASKAFAGIEGCSAWHERSGGRAAICRKRLDSVRRSGALSQPCSFAWTGYHCENGQQFFAFAFTNVEEQSEPLSVALEERSRLAIGDPAIAPRQRRGSRFPAQNRLCSRRHER